MNVAHMALKCLNCKSITTAFELLEPFYWGDTIKVRAGNTKESNLAKLFGEMLSLPEAQRPSCRWSEHILT